VNYRFAETCDLSLLAQLNHELIRDEGADNPMTLTQLQERMRIWLSSQYRAVLFEEASATAGYALFRSDEEGIHLRHFFIARSMRRRGYGRRGIQILLQEVWPKGSLVTVEVLHHNESALAFWQALEFIDHTRTLKIST
jgi:GNAT superfamily N-acetyltransferase